MKIAYSPYKLITKQTSQSHQREGALLRVEFNNGSVGYADCHPWPELGDSSLVEQLSHLRQRKTTPLMRCSLSFAYLDAQARKQQKSLFAERSVPPSHFLITDLLSWKKEKIEELIAQGYARVKIKLGKHISQEIAHLLKLFVGTPIRLCLDFNNQLSMPAFETFLRTIVPLHSSIDFIEDPFPFDPVAWKRIQSTYAIRLACDRQPISALYSPDSISYWIVKPAIQHVEMFNHIPKEKLIVTSYLDHPVGQVTAAYVAQQVDPTGSRIHGLLSHHVYQENPFSHSLSQRGPQFAIPNGFGFGYDEQLAKLEWKPLIT